VNTTIVNKTYLLGVFLCWLSLAQAQTENSPYSRYGLGDVVSSQNIVNRGMGGLSSAYYDFNTINFVNPASYARLQATTLDIGLDWTTRTLKSTNPPRKFSSYSPNIGYVQLGIPLKRNGGWGLNVGLRPITRINYKIGTLERKPLRTDGDSVNISTLYEGSGGAYQAYIGTGVTIAKDLTVGINFGYLFGTKDYSTRVSIPDTLAYFYRSNHQDKSRYGGILLNLGAQYTYKIDKKNWLRFGAHGNFEQKFTIKKDIIRESFEYTSAGGAPQTVDSVFHQHNIKGKVTFPASFGAGVIYDRAGKWLIGVDFTQQKWSGYQYFGEKDQVQDNWQMSVGAQITPTTQGGTNYWSFVAYRAGFTFGKDYINVDKELNKWTISVGAGFPMRKPAYTNQFSVINTTLEFGRRGDGKSLIRENFFRIGIGLSLSDIWFQKYKYD
jgi:hypothetical protein